MAYTSKQFVMVSLGVVLLGVALVCGLKGILPSEAEGPVTVEKVFEEWGLKLSVSVEKAAYSFKGPVNVTFSLSNVGNETVKYSTTRSNYRFDFAVYNSTFYNGTDFTSDDPPIVYLWSFRTFFPLGETITLNPGDSIAKTLKWPSYAIPAPGTYYIFGMTGHIGWIERGAQRVEPLGLLYMEEPIEVTILPSP